MPISKLSSTRDFLRVIYNWKKQSIYTFLLVVGFFVFYAYTATPSYVSSAKILLLPKSNQDLVVTAEENQQNFIRPVSEEDINTEVELLLSDKVIADTVKSFQEESIGLKLKNRGLFDAITDGIKGIVRWFFRLLRLIDKPLTDFEAQAALLKNSLDVEPGYNANVIFVNLRGEQANRTAEVLNRLLDVYIRHHNDVFSIQKGFDFYTDQAETYRQKLETAENDLKAFQKDWRIVNLNQQNEANIGLLTEFYKELKTVEIEIEESGGKIDILKRSLSENSEMVAVTKDMRTIPAIVELEKGIIPLLIKRTETHKIFTPESREYRDINEQIEMLRNEIKKEVQKAIQTDELELQSLSIKKKALLNKIEELQKEASALNQKEKELDELLRQVDLHKKNFMMYASKTEDTRMYDERKKRDMANVAIADHASVSAIPESPKRLLLIAVSILLGCFSALCLPFILEVMDRKLKTVDDIETLLGLPVVASFAEIND